MVTPVQQSPQCIATCYVGVDVVVLYNATEIVVGKFIMYKTNSGLKTSETYETAGAPLMAVAAPEAAGAMLTEDFKRDT